MSTGAVHKVNGDFVFPADVDELAQDIQDVAAQWATVAERYKTFTGITGGSVPITMDGAQCAADAMVYVRNRNVFGGSWGEGAAQRVSHCRLEVYGAISDIAPTVDLAIEMHPITSVAAGANGPTPVDSGTITLGVTIAAPAALTTFHAESTPAAVAEGFYLMRLTPSAAPAASCNIWVCSRLQMADYAVGDSGGR